MDRRQQLRGYLGDYLQQKGLPLRRAFRCLSPQHEDRHPSMRYHREKQTVHCFSCGATYDLFDLVGMDYGLDSFAQQMEKACELFGFTSGTGERRLLRAESRLPAAGGRLVHRGSATVSVGQGHPSLEQLLLSSGQETADGSGQASFEPAGGFPDRTEDLLKLRELSAGETGYFTARGISFQSCEQYGLFEAQGRAYIPVIMEGICTGWCGRAVDDGVQPRYKNSSGPLGVWNGDRLLEDGQGKCLYITEGALDAIALEQLGYAAVALCGSQNVRKLTALCDRHSAQANSWRLVACGDGDDAGKRMNEALKTELGKRGLSVAVLELPEGEDANGMALRSKEELLERLRRCEDGERVSYPPSAQQLVEDFFKETARRRAEGISTGFDGLDDLLDGGLYPGLYVLGAISSLGKTSFALQMADYLAAHGTDVLYFSLEQSRQELMAKSLSRQSAQLDGGALRHAFTARQLLRGDLPPTPQAQELLLRTKQAYSGSACGVYIKEGIADIGPCEIRQAVREHLSARRRTPVVMVDYLQILKPSDLRATDKQNVDRAVVELKRLSRDFDTAVLAISSFNRENYRTGVSMESFKESGAVEYSSDVLLGLQLAGAGDKEFDVNAAKAREPRQVELVLLKNRNGVPYGKIRFSYRAKFNWFMKGPL